VFCFVSLRHDWSVLCVLLTWRCSKWRAVFITVRRTATRATRH
jgi:hypothetical protein